jgi:hypothetical protein
MHDDTRPTPSMTIEDDGDITVRLDREVALRLRALEIERDVLFGFLFEARATPPEHFHVWREVVAEKARRRALLEFPMPADVRPS